MKKKFKVLGAKSIHGAVEYCQMTIAAENEKKARNIFLIETRFYEVIRVEEIQNEMI